MAADRLERTVDLRPAADGDKALRLHTDVYEITSVFRSVGHVGATTRPSTKLAPKVDRRRSPKLRRPVFFFCRIPDDSSPIF